ncbi:phosphoglycerate mutase [Luteimonas aestuarii]|uniref:Phosphoglycerate mutase n=1 Tax=Luteimonas aestuarii TaxID=453837 RepID=A0A4V3ALL0_9GAMM|nr:phosphoglycerate mutase [Luteimonas aestuarii]TDK23411.1 phosphoglycerate mutase [Luteimonas aestuarii]
MKATLLLPASRRFGAQSLSPEVARALGRADRLPVVAEGRRALLSRHFRLLPNGWPVAALTREADAGDAAGAIWLRADPCHVLPDINGARLLAHGESLALTREDVDALLPPLRPIFGDAGVPIDAPTPSRWYLRLPTGSIPPDFSEPDDALGTDVFDHLPGGSADGRRWRTLLSEAQVVLHNHPWNARRVEQGKPAVNSLWFWGGGALPDRVQSPHTRYAGDDETGISLAHAAGILAPPRERFEAGEGDVAFDLVATRDLAALEREWLAPALAALRDGQLEALGLDSEDGVRRVLHRSHRWRFWRSPLAGPSV